MSTFRGLVTRFREQARTALMPLSAPSVKRTRDFGYCRGDHRLFEEVVRGRDACFRTAARCKVVRAGYRDPVSVRENGL